ncbi:MAG: hypothetical protein MHPSP_001679 [Paramarteilia canceri]
MPESISDTVDQNSTDNQSKDSLNQIKIDDDEVLIEDLDKLCDLYKVNFISVDLLYLLLIFGFASVLQIYLLNLFFSLQQENNSAYNGIDVANENNALILIVTSLSITLFFIPLANLIVDFVFETLVNVCCKNQTSKEFIKSNDTKDIINAGITVACAFIAFAIEISIIVEINMINDYNKNIKASVSLISAIKKVICIVILIQMSVQIISRLREMCQNIRPCQKNTEKNKDLDKSLEEKIDPVQSNETESMTEPTDSSLTMTEEKTDTGDETLSDESSKEKVIKPKTKKTNTTSKNYSQQAKVKGRNKNPSKSVIQNNKPSRKISNLNTKTTIAASKSNSVKNPDKNTKTGKKPITKKDRGATRKKSESQLFPSETIIFI